MSRSRLDRIESKKKSIDSIRKRHHYTGWPNDGRFKTPGKVKAVQDKELDRAGELDKEKGIPCYSPYSEWGRLWDLYNKEEVNEGYFVPRGRNGAERIYKKVSRRKIRSTTKEELFKDLDEIRSNVKGSSENKKFDYYWSID